MGVPEFKSDMARINAGIIKQPILKVSKHTVFTLWYTLKEVIK